MSTLQQTIEELEDGTTEIIWRAVFDTTDLEHAACLARIALANPHSPYAIFTARCADGRREVIDLQRTGLLH